MPITWPLPCEAAMTTGLNANWARVSSHMPARGDRVSPRKADYVHASVAPQGLVNIASVTTKFNVGLRPAASQWSRSTSARKITPGNGKGSAKLGAIAAS